MEATVVENNETKNKSESKKESDGIKNVGSFKRGHPYLVSRNVATSETRETNSGCGCHD